jgi:hypothetical protein
MDISTWKVSYLFPAEEKKMIRPDRTFKLATARINILRL